MARTKKTVENENLVATVDETDATPKVEFSIPTGNLYGKDASELANGLAITAAGEASGSLKYVTGYTGFNGTVVAEQTGYFLPFAVKFPANTTKATMQVVGGSGKKVDILTEKFNVVRLGETQAESVAKSIAIEYTVDSKVNTVTIVVNKLKYEAKDSGTTEPDENSARYYVTLKDKSLANHNHTVYMPKYYVEFKNGKSNVAAETKTVLEKMGLI